MPTNAYIAPARSGKTYHVLKNVIIPAVAAGRRVVTNIYGIKEEAIHRYVVDKGLAQGPLGAVVCVDTAAMGKEGFFPIFDAETEVITPGFVLGGDLVIVDESSKFWGTGKKLSPRHLEFLTEHGHFVSSETGQCCDLVLIVQAHRLLHADVRANIDKSFVIRRQDDVGMGGRYLLTSYYGCGLRRADIIQSQPSQKFEKEIFGLYDSFHGGKGEVKQTDSAGNFWSGRKVKLFFLGTALAAGWSIWGLTSVFSTPDTKDETPKPGAAPSAGHVPPQGNTPRPGESEWRAVGYYRVGGHRYVVVARDGVTRTLVNPRGWVFEGQAASGQLDGKTVAEWTGAPPGKLGSGMFGGSKH